MIKPPFDGVGEPYEERSQGTSPGRKRSSKRRGKGRLLPAIPHRRQNGLLTNKGIKVAQKKIQLTGSLIHKKEPEKEPEETLQRHIFPTLSRKEKEKRKGKLNKAL